MRIKIPIIQAIAICWGCILSHTSNAGVIDIKKFGAVGDGKTDDTAAFQKAGQAIKDNSILLLPKGKYLIKGVNAAIPLEKLNNISIEGNDSELIAGNPNMTIVKARNCKNVTIKNLTVYWDKPYFSQGKIIDSTANSLDIKVDDNYPINDKVKIENVMDYDPVSKVPLANFDLFKSAIIKQELISHQTLRLTIKKNWSTPDRTKYLKDICSKIPQGTLIVLRHTVYGKNAFDIAFCENVTMDNIKIWGAPGMGIHMTMCKDVQVKKLIIEPKPGTDRLMSTTADAFFIMFPRGKLTIEDSRIESSGDDCLAINGKYWKLSNQGEKGILKFKVEVGWRGPMPQAGDKIDFYNEKDLQYKTTLTVDKASYNNKDKRFEIKFQEEIPKTLAVGDAAYNSAFACDSVNVKNTTLGANSARATIISARNVNFENVKIHKTGLAGAMIFGDTLRSHRPGPSAKNVTFSNCIFDSCALTPLIVYTGAKSPGNAQKNINIINCKFTEDPALKKIRAKSRYPNIMFYQAAINFKDVNKGLIKGNSFAGYDVAIYLKNVKDVTVKNNHCLDSQPSKIIIDEKNILGLNLKENVNFVKDIEVSKYNGLYYYYNNLR